MKPLSVPAQSVWAKSDYGVGERWLPLFVHASDTCGAIQRLWDEWLPEGTRQTIAAPFGGDKDLARRVVAFLGAVHDIGKATPVFQSGFFARGTFGDEGTLAWKPRKAGLPVDGRLIKESRPSHPIAGQVILEKYLTERRRWGLGCARSYSSVVGAHHGRPPRGGDIAEAKDYLSRLGWTHDEDGPWWDVQVELIEFARDISGLDDGSLLRLGEMPFPMQASSLVVGLLIMADWLASNQEYYPLLPLMDSVVSPEKERAGRAWEMASIPPAWSGLPDALDDWMVSFAARFGLPNAVEPRPVQRAAMEVAVRMEAPGIIVIEAPMGEGKTEAALAAAEILGVRTGRGGVCVALPTMATTDAMFGRVREWLAHVSDVRGKSSRSIYLAHGKAQLNEEYQGIVRRTRYEKSQIAPDLPLGKGAPTEDILVSDWLFGSKKGMLANFVVCTVDQVLMGALEMKHLALRQLALANKVVIIDECHAYDAYMQCYLRRALEWLGAWGTPVVLLSATLPDGLRAALVDAYRQGRDAVTGERPKARNLRAVKRQWGSAASQAVNGEVLAEPTSPERRGYPCITYAGINGERHLDVGSAGRRVTVRVALCQDDDAMLVAQIEDLLAGGGCAGVICDTVARAQRAADVLSAQFGEGSVLLVHSRFTDLDRMDNERRLREKLGPRATKANGKRPDRLIVVGTQVLEQSLDIDFDLLITDIAPMDLLLQRMGRLHRHARGVGESDRPEKLRVAQCLVRGIDSLEENGPKLSKGIGSVYATASLFEALAVMGLTSFEGSAVLELPGDIAPLVQKAYGEDAAETVPETWRVRYAQLCKKRGEKQEQEKARASSFLLRSPKLLLKHGETQLDLFNVNLNDPALSGASEQRGIQAVRDTQETIEVLLLGCGEEGLCLLPWVGDPAHGVKFGERVPIEVEPREEVAKLLSQCCVRLPLDMCRMEDLDGLIGALEGIGAPIVGAWQSPRWLAGRLVVVFEGSEELSTEVYGHRLTYTRERGLVTAPLKLFPYQFE